MSTRPDPPLPANETVLICGYRLPEDADACELHAPDIPAALRGEGDVAWLHFGLANARARRVLLESTELPGSFRERIEELDPRPAVEAAGNGLLVVINDLSFEGEADPGAVATLWAFATPRLAVTARNHALRSTDTLRHALRGGARFASGIALMAQLFEIRTRALRTLAGSMAGEVDDIEDEILLGDIPAQRQRLGVVRRRCARVRRHFVPDRIALNKFLAHRPAWLGEADAALLAEAAEDLTYVLEEVGDLYDRAKLLQEELSSRVAETTGTRLYVLSVLSAILLPMTLVTGIFGMNVTGVPGVEGAPTAFAWTMLAVVAAGACTLLFLRWRRLL